MLSYSEYIDMANLITQNRYIFFALLVWTAIWKGLALWKAARSGSKPWYVALLLINTIGLLEIVYIFFFSKKENSNQN